MQLQIPRNFCRKSTINLSYTCTFYLRSSSLDGKFVAPIPAWSNLKSVISGNLALEAKPTPSLLFERTSRERLQRLLQSWFATSFALSASLITPRFFDHGSNNTRTWFYKDENEIASDYTASRLTPCVLPQLPQTSTTKVQTGHVANKWPCSQVLILCISMSPLLPLPDTNAIMLKRYIYIYGRDVLNARNNASAMILPSCTFASHASDQHILLFPTRT